MAPWRVGVGANDYSSHSLSPPHPHHWGQPSSPTQKSLSSMLAPTFSLPPSLPYFGGQPWRNKGSRSSAEEEGPSCPILPSEGCVHQPPPALPLPSAAAHNPRPWIQSENGNIPPHCERSPFPTLPTQRGNNSKKGAI